MSCCLPLRSSASSAVNAGRLSLWLLSARPRHCRAVELLDAGAAERRKVDVDLVAEDPERPIDARAAAGRKPVEKGAPDHACPGPERQRLEHIVAAAHAAVENDLGAARDGVDRARQGGDGGGHAV